MRSFLALFLALSLHAAPVPIFDGKTLAGWEGDTAWWRVEGGEIRGGSFKTKVPKNLFLATEKSYQNFDLRIKLRLTGTGFVNSGVQMRSVRVQMEDNLDTDRAPRHALELTDGPVADPGPALPAVRTASGSIAVADLGAPAEAAE